jgi:glutaconate CoA-transferase subunit A
MLEQLLLDDVDALAARVPNGAKIAVTKNQSGGPAAIARALIRRRARGLHLVGVPTTGYVADILIGAGCVAIVETSAVTLDETGLAPRFIEAVKSGTVTIIDSTCPAIYSGLLAGEKGIPFIPIRGLIGSDVAAHRADYKIIENPYASGDEILLLPAIVPDVALLHAPMADRHGNIYFGQDRDFALIAHASKRALVSIESIYDGCLLDDPQLAAATLSSIYVGAVAIAARGAWPLGLREYYVEDAAHLAHYRALALSPTGFTQYRDEFIAPLAAAV